MTAATVAGLLAHNSPGAVVFLIKIEHTVATLFLTNNNVALTYSGQAYTPAGFILDPPGETEESLGVGKITFCAVDQNMMALFRTAEYPMVKVTFMAAYWTASGTFDAFMTTPLYVSKISGDVDTIVAELTMGEELSCELGPLSFTTNNFPGLF
jgi:hypothetical protein